MRYIAFLLLLCSATINLKSQDTYIINYIEIYENNEVSYGDSRIYGGDRIIIDKKNNRITLALASEKQEIFRILKSKPIDDEILYSCETKTENGLIEVDVFYDEFYKYFKFIRKGESGNFVKYYFR